VPYIENPKTKGSGIICCIPQTGRCPNRCEDCFFQSGRSYLEPLSENLPNIPPTHMAHGRVVRMNDGNDSNVHRDVVEACASRFPDAFFNTARPDALEKYPGPVVLTVNPGPDTDDRAVLLEMPPVNLMFVRFRANTWNADLMHQVVTHYSVLAVPIVLTFMAYHDMESIPYQERYRYILRTRTRNAYWAIRTFAWEGIMERFRLNKWVHSCGKIEGELGTSLCRHCGNCLSEYYAAKERMRDAASKADA